MRNLFSGKGAASLRNGLVESYTFDLAALTTGVLGHTLTASASPPTVTTGKIGQGANFVRASNQSYKITSGSAADFKLTTGLTIALWSMPATSGSEMAMVSKFLTTGNQRGYALEIASSNAWNLIVSSGGTANNAVVNRPNAILGAWSCVIAWYDGTNINMQINNGGISSTAFSAGIFAADAPFEIGTFNNGGAFMFNGALDGICIANRAWTAAERAAFYKAGVGRQYPFR